MDSERHVEFLGLGEKNVVVRMRMRLASHHELRDPSAFASGFDRAFELDRSRRGIAERKMRDRYQTSMALRAEVHDVAVVGASISLREFGVVGLGLPEQAHRWIEERGGESFRVDSLETLLGVHRAEGRHAAVSEAVLPFVVARGAHRGEAAEASA